MSGQIFITRNGEETAFAKPLKRAVLRDKRLTFGARGLFCMLWDFPNNWSFYISHIVNFSPSGVTQLRSYLKELREIGAIEITPRRITPDEAVVMSNQEKKYKGGQIIGQKWILNHPDSWAIEALLSIKPSCRISASRPSAKAEKPDDEIPHAKGVQYEGSVDTKKQLQVTEDKTEKREYHFPVLLSPKERNFAETLLIKTDAITAQKILDVLSEKLSNNKIQGSPIGYLHTLVERANRGQFFSQERSAGTYKSRQLQKRAKEISPPKRKAKAEPIAIEAHINELFRTIGKVRNGHKSKDN